MNYFVLTMQYNEDILLPIFIDHYSGFLDKKDIKIIDHGSTIDFSNVVSGCDRIQIPRQRPFAEGSRLRLIQHTVAAMLEYYDFGIFVDCDELIDLTDIGSIHFSEKKIHFVAGFDVFYRKTEQGLRLHGLLNPGMCKPSVFSYIPYWGPGFHSSGDTMNILRLPMAHVRFLFKDHAVKRALDRLGVHEKMDLEEKNSGINIHWGRGLGELDQFYRYVDQKSVEDVKTFTSLDPALFANPVDAAKGYQFSNTEYDLTERFPNLLI
jgi:hypothetical protein